ncbi:MAG TPA: hypothetical protein DEF47_06640 [Herpetosiphon sp.]|uniref:Uncharacterized protein n=1 Tax=Herpetosiphon aurantiacus (strain ATCC 23779 / DSM 785 / 114-95) TaxID=316274 RepID=A9B4C6_HERA2|nr:hypothetical protein [Herpetosiphon sp.]ABX02683.1 conserved hypothetical protein [Herpetosiphon aurantiacus DSM 785]HBW49563.1 hypothetical protein [Herpetosiphon sp.]
MTTTAQFPEARRTTSGAGAILRQFWATSKGMTIFFLLSCFFLVLAIAGVTVDPREVLGQPVWMKSLKFAVSFVVYAPTVLWMFSYVKLRPRLMRFVMDACAAALSIEIVLFITQAVRGQPMHFNVATPIDETLWSIMGTTITVFYLINIVGFVVFLRQKPIADRVFMLSLKLGMGLMLLGFGLGFLMTNPSPAQMEVLQAGGSVPAIGAHTVGAADGGRGIAILGWSSEHGDLRIAHFVGIHGAQVLALIGWLLYNAKQRFNDKQRLALTWGAAVAYLGLVASVTVQALRGQALLQPDATTWISWIGLVVGSVLFTSVVVNQGSVARVQGSGSF